MGSCYSRLGSKSRNYHSSDSPFDTKHQLNDYNRKMSKQFHNSNNSVNVDKTKQSSSKLSYFNKKDNYLSSNSFEHLSFSDVKDKQTANSMSSANRHKIPVLSSKTNHQNKSSQELANQTNRKIGSNKVMICDNYSSTSISSGSSINLSKCSFKSSSSSSALSSIARPKSRPLTPTFPVNDNNNTKVRNASQYKESKSKTSTNNLTHVSNGNRVNSNGNSNRNYTHQIEANVTHNVTANGKQTVNGNEANKRSIVMSKANNGIKYKTQMSGLPRPQTAHIVSTSHSDAININKFRFLQYNDSTATTAESDQNLRHLSKPSYYYESNNQCPYKRPNFNLNKLHFQALTPLNINHITANDQNASEKQSNPKLTNNNTQIKSECDNNKEMPSNRMYDNDVTNRQLNLKNNNITADDSNETTTNNNSSEVSKSIQRVKELEFLNIQNNSKTVNNNIINNQNVSNSNCFNDKPDKMSSPERNSISSSTTNCNEQENRDFLIDDEICDQPELVLSASLDKRDMIKNLHTKLDGLIGKQDNVSLSSNPSSPVSKATASPMSQTSINTTTFRKPRPLSFVELPNGSYGLDSPSFRAACQDLIGIKTLLFRLQGILQNAETLNPFDHNYSQKFYQQLIESENDGTNANKDQECIKQENIDLRRQMVLMQQQMEDKDRTIRLLQQQMAKYSNINSAFVPENVKREMVNSTSQTDCCKNASNIDPRNMSDGSSGMLVSFWISRVPAYA